MVEIGTYKKYILCQLIELLFGKGYIIISLITKIHSAFQLKTTLLQTVHHINSFNLFVFSGIVGRSGGCDGPFIT